MASQSEQPGDLWLRLRFRRSRLPRSYPADISPDVLLRQLLKAAGRRWGWELQELREVKDQDEVTE